MCSLCGILGGGTHWTDSAGHADAFPGRTEAQTRRAERQAQTRLVNRILAPYGLQVGDWAGTSYVLKSSTGRTALVDNLSQLWALAEDLSGKACDPLDDALLAALAEAGR